jgi:SAM-dependent methyltransferase
MGDESTVRYARARVWQDDQARELQRFFDAYFEENGPLAAVLDAGAGHQLPLDIPLDVHLSALDLSEEALAKNENADTKIVGDVQTYEFRPGSFDAVICWWVLEHLREPARAIARLATALRSGGLLVVAVPYLWGFKALATKATPYRFHVWLARRSNGLRPYQTFLRRDLSPRRLDRIARAQSLDLTYARTYNARPEQILPRPLEVTWRALGTSIRTATFALYDPLLSEHIAVFRKR